MQIDTYVVKIQPNFDINAFDKIKKKIQNLKSPVKIPIEVTFNSTSLRGLKSKIKNEVDKNHIKLKLPVEPILTGKSLKDFKNSLSFKPIQIPAVLKFDKDSLDIIRELWNQAGLRDDGRGNGGNRSGFGRLAAKSLSLMAAPITKPLNAANRIANYTLGGVIIDETTKMLQSPFKVEDNLYQILAISDFTNASFDGMNEIIKEISRNLPIMASELSDTALEMARANVTAEDLFGIKGDKSNKQSFFANNSLLALTAKLAAYTSEAPQSVYNLTKKLKEAFPEVDSKKMADLLAGAADATQWTYNQMGQYVSAIGAGTIRNANILPDDFFGVMALQSLGWARPSDAGTSFKTFNQFSKNAKSDKAEGYMDILGLDRWNDKETDLKNFMKYLYDINKLYQELDKNSGTIVRKVTNKKGELVNKTFTRKDVEGMIYGILGSDASRMGNMLDNDNLKETLNVFDKYINTASLDQKMAIRSQSTLYQLHLLRSELENAFLEIFDKETINYIGEQLTNIAIWIKTIISYVKEMGGLSGIWDKFMDSKVMVWLNGILDTLKIIMSLFGVDIDKRLAAMKQSTMSNDLMQRFDNNKFANTISKDSSLQNPAFRTPLQNKLLSEHNKVNSDNTATIQVTQNIYGSDSGTLADKASRVWSLTPIGQANAWNNRLSKFINDSRKVEIDDANYYLNGP